MKTFQFYEEITRRRKNRRGWVYAVCVVLLLVLLVWSVTESIWGAVPVGLFAGVLTIQMMRPSLLGWFTLVVLFFGYGATVLYFSGFDDLFMCLIAAVFGFFPFGLLLCNRPTKLLPS